MSFGYHCPNNVHVMIQKIFLYLNGTFYVIILNLLKPLCRSLTSIMVILVGIPEIPGIEHVQYHISFTYLHI